MLLQRILTAIPLAVLVIWGVLTQPADIIFYALLFVSFISGWEWARLSGINNVLLRVTYAVALVVCIYLAQHYLSGQALLLQALFAVALGYWFIATYQMFIKGPVADHQVSIRKMLVGVIVLLPPILALMQIREQSADWLFFCLSIIWIADIGAYFSGKRFGKRKLAPGLSPGKTREGLYGAMFATAVYSFIAGYYFELQVIDVFMLLIIAALATVVSVIGDLYLSLLKREKGLKDTGHILPGHGGVLDRIDSVTSSSPFLALMLGLVIF